MQFLNTLLDREHRAFIDLFSELRNRLVHDVRSVSFSFKGHFNSLPKGDLHRWAAVLIKAVGGDPAGKAAENSEDLLLQDPRTVLGYAVLATLAQALFKIDPTEYDRALAEAKRVAPTHYVALALALITTAHAFQELGIPLRKHGDAFSSGSENTRMPVLIAYLEADPETLGGTLVFVGTRVPLKNLFDYLESGHPLSAFLDDFPSVTREQALAALGDAYQVLSGHHRTAD